MVSADFTVRLDQVFQGPLDLLLHLVREQEVEIHEVEIGRVVEGFLAYLEGLEVLDIEVAGDFLVMAATLIAIKSRSLLPTEEVDLEDDLDPRDELIQRLIEYRRFKSAAGKLEEAALERSRMHGRGWSGELREHEEAPTLELGELSIWDVFSTYSRLLRETAADRPHRVKSDPRPLRFFVESTVRSIKSRPSVTLSELVAEVEGGEHRDSVVGSFCALLELARMGLVTFDQELRSDDIVITLRPEHRDDVDRVVAQAGFDDEDDDEDESEGPQASSEDSNAGSSVHVRLGSDWADDGMDNEGESTDASDKAPGTEQPADPEL